MYQVNDIIVYKRDVCKIKQIKEKYYQDNDYYVLVPIQDESLKIEIPVHSPFIKELITKEEIQKLIQKIPHIPIIDTDTKLIENEYKSLLASMKYEDLIRIIKTTYLRNKNRTDNHKKIGDKDQYYFLMAENYLYQEFSIVLDMSIDEVKNYIIEQVILFST